MDVTSTLEGLTSHEESSLSLAEVTKSGKRRQSERQAVTQVKLIEPRKLIILRSTGSLSGKTTVGDRFGKVSGDSGGVVEAQHALKTIWSGTREIRFGLKSASAI